MSPVRVLEVGKSTAGIGAYLRYLACGLNKTKFQPTFVCLSEGGPELANELSKEFGVQAISLQMNRFNIDILGDLLLVFRLARLIKATQYDLIHAHGSKAGFLVRMAAIGSGIPVIYSPHCFAFHEGVGRLQAHIYASIERLAAHFWTAKIVTVSDAEQILAKRHRVGSPQQFVTVRTGMDIEAYQVGVDRVAVKESLNLPLGTPLVGSVGRLGEQKDPLTFVRMAALVHEQMPDVNFVWAGTGLLLSDAKKMACELGVLDRVHFIGEQRDVPSVLNILDCFVLCSRWEGLSIVLLEAMAAGVPVVATEIPSNAELITNGVSGWLAPVGDASTLAGCVVDLLRAPVQANSFSEQSQEHVRKNFTFHQMMTAIQKIYNDVYHSNMARV